MLCYKEINKEEQGGLDALLITFHKYNNYNNICKLVDSLLGFLCFIDCTPFISYSNTMCFKFFLLFMINDA